MKRYLILPGLLLAAALAGAATTATVTPGPWSLYAGTKKTTDHATEAACVEAAKALAKVAKYTCRTSTGVSVAITVDPPVVTPPVVTPPVVTPPAATAAPALLYTDALTGPTAGGERGQGGYLSVFGRGFGAAAGLGTRTKVFIGSAEVASYRYLGPSKVDAKLGLQQITVQVGTLAGAAVGKPLAVRVVVDGVASTGSSTFAPSGGRVLFVSQTGNDSTAEPGNIDKPWRTLQTPARGGAYAAIRAGDHVVIRGGHWTDVGFETAWLRFRDSAQLGRADAWVHITAYPTEDVHYSTPAGAKGGIHGPGSAYYGTTGEYVSVSNLRMDVDAAASSDAAPINLQSSGGHWRVVNNELGPWPSKINSKAAGVSGHGAGVQVLGNRIFGFACVGALENHGVYADSGASDWEIAYNHIHDITGGNLIQFFDNLGAAGKNYSGLPAGWAGFTGMQVHHNWMEGSGKYGLNLADSIVSGQIWNNVITRATYAGLRINTISKNMDMVIAQNTFYDNDRLASGSGNAQILNSWGNYGPTGTIRIEGNIFSAGPGTLRSSSYYVNAGNTDAYLAFKGNQYWDAGYGWKALARDAAGVYVDPKLDAATLLPAASSLGARQ